MAIKIIPSYTIKYYLDTDVFLALLKEQNRLKEGALHFFQKHRQDELYTSSICCLEIWFYLYRHNKKYNMLDAVRCVQQLCTVIETTTEDLTQGILLAQEYDLSPADALHAIQALRLSLPLVSSDGSFEQVKGLKQIDYTQDSK